MLLRCHSLGGAKAAFPRSRHGRSSDRDQRRQGCAAPAGLDLDASARRGRKMTGGLEIRLDRHLGEEAFNFAAQIGGCIFH
jgi:hypothetical protein